MEKTFTQRRKELREEALKAIDSYDGPKALTLATGDKALDWDDAWLIIGNGDPVIRHKKSQRAIEKGREPSWRDIRLGVGWDIRLGVGWDTISLCELADKLAAGK